MHFSTSIHALFFFLASSSQCDSLRHSNCSILICEGHVTRCKNCSAMRSNLRIKANRFEARDSERNSLPSSHTNFRYLNTPEKIQRLKNLQREKRCCQKKLDYLNRKLANILDRQGEYVDEQMSSDLVQIVEDKENLAHKFPPQSFGQLFWEQQRKAASQKNPRGMRWHPLMIRWCLYIHHLSSKAYMTLRESGCLILPSQRTLRDYSHCVNSEAGFSGDVDKMLSIAAHIETCSEPEKMVSNINV